MTKRNIIQKFDDSDTTLVATEDDLKSIHVESFVPSHEKVEAIKAGDPTPAAK